MSKYFLYARKSTDTEEKQVLSIEAQLVEVRLFAEREKLQIVREFTESKTAKIPGRPIFNEMLLRMEKGEAQGIISWHPDRLARNSIDGGRIIYLLDTNHIRFLKFPTFWFESTPQGKFMLQIAFGQSKYYIDNLSENVKRGQRQKLRRGEWPFQPPLGYLAGGRYSYPKADPVKGPLIKKLFETYATGDHTLDQLFQMAHQWGLVSRTGKQLARGMIYRILQNPFYYGLVIYKDECAPGVHTPLVSKVLFDQVQQTLKERGKPNKFKKHHFPLLGLAKCGACGGAITAELQKGHTYYRCTKKKGACNEPYLREESFDQQITQAIQNIALPLDVYEKFMDRLAKEGAQSRQSVATTKKEIEQELACNKSKQEKLLHVHLEGLVTSEEYQITKQTLLKDEVALKERLTNLSQGATGWLEPMQNFLRAAHQAGELAGGGDLGAKKEFFKKIGSNPKLAAKTLSFSTTFPWALAQKSDRIPEMRARRDSNSRPSGS